ncbi:MAG: flagellar biosynthetic protein FliR [Verrucomicrobia bacterium]|nr:flagellar biosynthetic protein FliR [Verrucomicrobiota bacterium]
MEDSFTATESYLNLLLALPKLEPYTVLSVFFLTLARILPLMIVAPFLGAPRTVPMTMRMMFSVALVAIFLPQNLLAVHTEIPYNMTWIWLMIKELLIGAILGFLSAIPFFMVTMAGSLIDHSRGSSALQVNDPLTQTQTGPVGILFNYVLIAAFFSLDGPFIFFDGLADSYKLFPVDSIFNANLFSSTAPLWKQSKVVLQTIFNICVQLSAPALIGILLTDLFLGIANRLAPQVQIVFLGISLKSWVGIALLTAAWGLIIQVMSKESITWIKSLNQLIQQIGLSYVKSPT